MPYLSYLLIGCVAGFLGGLLGVGGGIIIVPALILLIGFEPKVAIGTSAAVIVFIALSAVVRHGQGHNVAWPVALVIAVGAIICSYLGACVTAKVDSYLLRRIFALFLIAVAVRLLVARQPNRSAPPWEREDVHQR